MSLRGWLQPDEAIKEVSDCFVPLRLTCTPQHDLPSKSRPGQVCDTQRERVRKAIQFFEIMVPFPYHHIVVIGTTSSGKSTLAERLAERLDMDFIELDALHWEPNWQEAPLEVFRARVEAATQAKRWVVAG